ERPRTPPAGWRRAHDAEPRDDALRLRSGRPHGGGHTLPRREQQRVGAMLRDETAERERAAEREIAAGADVRDLDARRGQLTRERRAGAARHEDFVSAFREPAREQEQLPLVP